MKTLAVLGASPLFRAGLVSLLKLMDFTEVQEGADLNSLKGMVNNNVTVPDVLVVKLSGAPENVAGFMDEARSWVPEIKVVFLASELEYNLLIACFSSGASGFLLENISREALQESLKLVCAGEKVFPSGLEGLLCSLTSKNGGAFADLADLKKFGISDREIDILRCLSVGQSNKVIANALHIAEATVKVHVKRILQKTHATNRTQAALWGAARGLASQPSPEPSQIVEETNRINGREGKSEVNHSQDREDTSLQSRNLTRSAHSNTMGRLARSQMRHRNTLPRLP